MGDNAVLRARPPETNTLDKHAGQMPREKGPQATYLRSILTNLVIATNDN